MKVRKELLLISVILIVFLAGCSSSTTSPGLGVSILSFKPEIPQTESNSPLSITATIKNTGAIPADNVVAELIGLPTGTSSSQWQFKSGEQAFISTPKSLFAADPTRGLPDGQQDTFTWDLTTPTSSVDQSYNFNTRVYYGYQTISSSTIRLVSLNYYRSLSGDAQSKLQRGVISSSLSNGPLSVSVKTVQPLITGTGNIPLQIDITNAGGGRVFITESKPVNNLDTVTVQVDGATCEGVASGTQFQERLLQGSARTIGCQLSIPTALDTFQDFAVKVTLTYRYFAEATSTVTVFKSVGITTPGTPTPPPIGTPTPPPTGGATPTGTSPATVVAFAASAIPNANGWFNNDFLAVFQYAAQQGATLTQCSYTSTGRTTPFPIPCSGTTFNYNQNIGVADCPGTSNGNCVITSTVVAGGVTNTGSATFKVDRIPPQFTSGITIDIPSDQNRVILGQATAYSISVIDAASGVDTCTLYLNNAPVGTMTASGNVYSVSNTFTDSGQTNVAAKVTCKDKAGNSADSPVVPFSLDKTAPVRSSPTANSQAAGSLTSPVMVPAGNVGIGLTTDKTATCKFNKTSSENSYTTFTGIFSDTVVTSTTVPQTHSAIVTSTAGTTSVYNVLCAVGGNVDNSGNIETNQVTSPNGFWIVFKS